MVLPEAIELSTSPLTSSAALNPMKRAGVTYWTGLAFLEPVSVSAVQSRRIPPETTVTATQGIPATILRTAF